jgi:hypothetical protein
LIGAGSIAAKKDAAQIGVVFGMRGPVGGIGLINPGFLQKPQQQAEFIGSRQVIVDHEQCGFHILIIVSRSALLAGVCHDALLRKTPSLGGLPHKF